MPDHLPERIPVDLQYPVPFRLRKDPVLWSASGIRHEEKTTGTVYPPPGLPSGCPWDFSRDRPWNFVFPVPGSLCDVRSGDQDRRDQAALVSCGTCIKRPCCSPCSPMRSPHAGPHGSRHFTGRSRPFPWDTGIGGLHVQNKAVWTFVLAAGSEPAKER